MVGGSKRSDGPGKGSEFIVYLPTVAPVAESQKSEPISEKPVTQTHRILVVDDNADAAESLAMLLEILGHETRVAHDGEAAVRVAAEYRPEVVLMDLGMPRVNGTEAARRIRLESWGKDMFLVALTGWGADDDRRRTQEAGFDRHLVKPVDLDALTKLLADLPVRLTQ